MSDKWRKASAVIFILTVVLYIIGLLGVVIMVAERGNGEEVFVTLLVGVIIGLVLFSLWGTVLEFFDNVAAIKEKICGSESENQQSQNRDSYVKSNTYSYMKTNTGSKVVTNYVIPIVDFCDCGQKLANGEEFCPACGKKQK